MDEVTFTDRRAAREVFISALLVRVQQFGAKSIDEILEAGLSWFYVAFSRTEIIELVEYARRLQLLEPLEQRHAADGKPIAQPEWAPTERGMAVTPCRGLGLGDVSSYVQDAVRRALSAQETIALVAAALTFVAGAAAGALSKGAVLTRVVIVAVGLLILWVLIIGRGILGNRDLSSAAASWARGKKVFCEYSTWQRDVWRQWLEPFVGTVWLCAFGVGIIAIGARTGVLWLVAGACAGIALFCHYVLYLTAQTWRTFVVHRGPWRLLTRRASKTIRFTLQDDGVRVRAQALDGDGYNCDLVLGPSRARPLVSGVDRSQWGEVKEAPSVGDKHRRPTPAKGTASSQLCAEQVILPEELLLGSTAAHAFMVGYVVRAVTAGLGVKIAIQRPCEAVAEYKFDRPKNRFAEALIIRLRAAKSAAVQVMVVHQALPLTPESDGAVLKLLRRPDVWPELERDGRPVVHVAAHTESGFAVLNVFESALAFNNFWRYAQREAGRGGDQDPPTSYPLLTNLWS